MEIKFIKHFPFSFSFKSSQQISTGHGDEHITELLDQL